MDSTFNSGWKPKPWVAVILGLLFQSFTFLYTNKAWLFWLYLLLSLGVAIVDTKYSLSLGLIFFVLCPVHSYFIAKRYQSTDIRHWYSKWWALPIILILFLLTIFGVRAFLYEPFAFPSRSMQPTIMPGDYVLVQKLGYSTYGTFGLTVYNSDVSEFAAMTPGKLYAFYPPTGNSPFVKRLIGIPGDHIYATGTSIQVNGKELAATFKYSSDEANVFEEQLGDEKYLIQHLDGIPPLPVVDMIVPEKSYYFLGDNRENSADSRIWGVVSADRIVGKVVFIFSSDAT